MRTQTWRRITRSKTGERIVVVTKMRGRNVARIAVKTYLGEYDKSFAVAEREAAEALDAMEAAEQAATTAIPA